MWVRGIDDRHGRCKQEEHGRCEHGKGRCKQSVCVCVDKEATIHYNGDGTTLNY